MYVLTMVKIIHFNKAASSLALFFIHYFRTTEQTQSHIQMTEGELNAS